MKTICPNDSCFHAALRGVAYWITLPDGYAGATVVVGVLSGSGETRRVIHEHGYYDEHVTRIASAPEAPRPAWADAYLSR